MKNLLFSVFLMCFSLLALANQTITVGGTVTDENTGLVVPDQMVFIYTDSTNSNSGYFSIVYTDADGFYSDAFEVSANAQAGIVNVFTFDCSGIAEFQQLAYGNGNFDLIADFQICTGVIQPYDCYADFWWWQNADLMVQFEDYSWPTPTSWAWDFGDGQTSTEQNPQHLYAQTGQYFVTLTIFVAETNCTSTTSWEIWVDNYNYECQAMFFWGQSWENPLSVEFYDNSWFVPGTWNWQFGDGQYSMEQNPVHNYAEPGIYEVTLTINGADSTCYDQYTEVIYLEEVPYGCWADFWWYQSGTSTVQFTNFSNPPNSSSFWDFGDGTSSTEQNPEHVFNGFGVFEVCLTIGDSSIGCQDTRCYEVWVDTNNYLECKADFWYFQMEDLNVQFQDYSWPMVSTWAWDFGDGQTSTEQNPVHQYAQTGIYPVTLTIFVEETGCTSTAFYEIWVDNYNYGCEAKYFWMPGFENPLAVEFFDASMYNSPVSWFWDFGDGNTSTAQNPVHIFATEDIYQVCLTISTPDSSCYSQFCSPVFPGGIVPPDCMNDFEVFDQGDLTFTFEGFTPNGGTNATEFLWDFGDNNVGQGPVVTHTYSMPGSYAVCLTTISLNPADSCIFTSCKGVYAGNGGGSMQANFIMQPDSMNTMVYHFYDTSTGNPFFWMWDFGDGSTSTEQHPIHEYAQAGWYEVCLTIIGQGMTDTYCAGFEMNAGALAITEPGKLISTGEIYPNPNNGNFAIDLEISKSTEVKVSIINYLGQEVYSRNENLQAGNTKLTLSLDNMPEGIYNLTITGEDQKFARKFILK